MLHSPVMNLAVRAARKAGALALRYFDRREQLQVREKAAHDFVSEADTRVEREILYHLRKGYPQYGVLAEESADPARRPTGHHWIIDPIDGTTNFLRGLPHFAISIALAEDDQVLAGLVYNPVQDELFTAEKGAGAFFNGHRIRVTNIPHLADAFLATGFPVRERGLRQAYLKSFGPLLLSSGPGVRRAGSAALDLAYTAAGRFDGFWEMNLCVWDIAAGILLVREAGGFVSDFNGGNGFLESGDVVAAGPGLHPRMLEKIRAAGLKSPAKDLLHLPEENSTG
ncbi:MAG: inositol monophosphatase [Magnetococcales bacterium]|nr:inositol monophosphatase [Magnetococcales bacterium]